MRFSEIDSVEKVTNEDLNYYEKEFNNIFLEDGYESLFKFENLKKLTLQ